MDDSYIPINISDLLGCLSRTSRTLLVNLIYDGPFPISYTAQSVTPYSTTTTSSYPNTKRTSTRRAMPVRCYCYCSCLDSL